MSRLLLLPVLLLTAVWPAGQAAAQSGQTARNGAFDERYPEAAALLHAFNVAHGTLLEKLHTGGASAASIEAETFDQLLSTLETGTHTPTALPEVMPSFAGFAPQIVQVIEWAHTLQGDIYDIYADDDVTGKEAAVDAAVGRYLARRDLALPATPKSMSMMTDQEYSSFFAEQHPKSNGLMWAAHWLQIAISDPMIYYYSASERDDGVAAVVERYRELLADAPVSFPEEMPTTPAVAPELVRFHPRAAAIFDNLNMLHDVVADILVHPAVTDKRAALDRVLGQFQDPRHLALTEHNWILMSLRSGIYYQGGPAIGRLDAPERNIRVNHSPHGGSTMVIPGMGAPGGMGQPTGSNTSVTTAPPRDGSAPASTPAPAPAPAPVQAPAPTSGPAPAAAPARAPAAASAPRRAPAPPPPPVDHSAH